MASPDSPAGGASEDARAQTSEQRRTEQRLAGLGRVAAGAAHDMNNVLGVILGYIELARMRLDSDPAGARAHLESALETVGRIREITDGMLDYAAEPQRPDLVPMNTVVREIRALLRAGVDPRIQIDLSLAEDLPLPALHESALRELVLALCLDAVDALPAGGALCLATAVEVREERGGLLPAGTYLSLRRTHTGPPLTAGMREAFLEGTAGAGRLQIVRALAERCGGSFEFVDTRSGSEILVRLPSELRVPERPGAQPASAPARFDILVVDDEPAVREVLRGLLELDGYVVGDAETGAEALALLRAPAGGARLVFLDNLLPDMRGAEIAWHLTALADPPIVVMVTGMLDAADRGALPPGTRVFQKPFLHRELSALLHEELRFEPGTDAS